MTSKRQVRMTPAAKRQALIDSLRDAARMSDSSPIICQLMESAAEDIEYLSQEVEFLYQQEAGEGI